MLLQLRATLIALCVFCMDAANGQAAKIVELTAAVPNIVHESPPGTRLFYASGVADPDIRVEVQIVYYTVEPDFGNCGGRSFGWPKPISLLQPVVFRPSTGYYGVLLSDQYNNTEDPRTAACKWRMANL